MPVKIKEIAKKLPERIKNTDWKALVKKPVFWCITTSVMITLCMVILVLVMLTRPAKKAENSPINPQGVLDISDTTEATLPPPEANPIGLGDFYTDENGYLSCLATPSVLGIDVSFWQGEIDWAQVKEAGVEFAMIRAGCRYSGKGDLDIDDYAQANYQGATDAGIKVGAYFFSQATSTEEAVEEAEYLLEIIRDWQVDMPIVFDWEFDPEGRTAKTDGRTITDCTKSFCDRIAQAGYTPMIYFGKSHSLDTLYLRELTDYGFWLAYYDTVLNYPYKIDMWQYTDAGSISGIHGKVDINLYFPYE